MSGRSQTRVGPAPKPSFTPIRTGLLQRKCACGGAPGLNGECLECRKKRPALQRRSIDQAGPSQVPPIVHDVLRSPGQPLDAAARASMERRFGHDFSRVRVHTDAKAAESAQAVNAVAYTVGRDVVFGAGQYAPAIAAGQRLLAHELTHVVQQDRVPASRDAQLMMGHEHDASEAEAQQASEDVEASGPPGGPSLKEHPSITVGKAVSDAPRLQRQFITPLGPGGGFGGLLERDRRRAFQRPTPAAGSMPRTVKVWINSFIPHATIEGPPGSECFTGDNRGFSNDIHASSRTHQEIEFDVATLRKTIDWKHVGTTHEVNCATGAVVGTATAPASELRNGSVARVPSRTPVMSAGGTVAPSYDVLVDFQAFASNPLVRGAPAIDLNVVWRINPMTRECELTGEHDGFPAYEAYVTADGGAGVPVYGYDPRTAGEDPLALFPPMDKTIPRAWSRF